jgi:hypothetical protein
MTDVDLLLGQPLVLTEKVDGANVCMTRDAVYARSHSGPARGPMFDRLKAIHAEKRWLIVPGVSVFCEWCMFVHSVEYANLPDPPLLVIGVRRDSTGVWGSWGDLDTQALTLGLERAPEVGTIMPSKPELLQREVEELAAMPSVFGGQREGIVVRHAGAVADDRFAKFHAKYVNEGFVAGAQLGAELRPQRISE